MWVPKTGALPSGAFCVSAPAGVECGSKPRERSRRYREGSDHRSSGLTWNRASIGTNLKGSNCQAKTCAGPANCHKSHASRQLPRCTAGGPPGGNFERMLPFVNVSADRPTTRSTELPWQAAVCGFVAQLPQGWRRCNMLRLREMHAKVRSARVTDVPLYGEPTAQRSSFPPLGERLTCRRVDFNPRESTRVD